MSFEFEKSHGITDALIYARVSSKSQVPRGDGLQSQQTRCEAYAKFKRYNVVHVFSDDLTGKRSDRPGVDQLISFLRSNRTRRFVVLIDDISRFARRVPVHFSLRDAIAEAGGVLESPAMVFRDDADGEFQEYILASVAQHQSRKNAEQTANRRQARCLNGFWPFANPIGYKHEKVKGYSGKLLVRDEPLASIIQEGLEGFASGRFASQVEVKRFFESQPAFPKDLPNGEIRNQRITDILRRVIYAGYITAPYYGISMVKAQHEPLISLEDHQRILDRLDGKRGVAARKDMSADFVLRGFVSCGDCGKPLTACWSKSKTGKRHPYYLCFNRACESHRKSIPRDKLEGEFAALLKSLKPTRGLFDVARAMFKDIWDQRAGQLKAMQATLKSDVKTIDKQIEQLVDRIVDTQNATAAIAYERKIEKLERKKHLALEKLNSGAKPVRPFKEVFELAFAFLANPCILWASERLEDRRTVLKLTFADRLSYSRNEGFRTPDLSLPFRQLGVDCGLKNKMAHRGRFELPTP
ncbi:MAG: recombinase family protein [Pseudomonadota bacterium]